MILLKRMMCASVLFRHWPTFGGQILKVDASGGGGGSSAWKSVRPPILCFGTIPVIYKMVSKQSSVEKDMKFVDGGRCSKFLCWWRLNFVPQLDLSVPMAWTWRLFS